MMNWKRTDDDTSEITEQNREGVCFLSFPALEKTGLVKHAFSTRVGGAGTDIYSTMNFSFSRGENPEEVRENYRRMAKALGADYGSFVVSEQEHTVNLMVVRETDKGCGVLRERPYREIDGLLTNIPGITLVTFYADCIPLYFLDPVKKAIALSHSGWKGTLAEMGRVTVLRMQKEFGSRPEDLIACIGPGICKDCYEVDGSVEQKFREGFKAGKPEEILSDPHDGDHWQLDLWKANRLILLSAGLHPENIHTGNICTHCNSDLLFSHRTAGEKRGNNAAFLALC